MNFKIEIDFKFDYVNFQTCKHWIQQIQFLGIPLEQDTKLDEHMHCEVKQIATRITNFKNTEKETLHIVINIYFKFFYKAYFTV